MDIARRSTALLLLTALVSLTSPAWAQRSEMARELARVTAVQVVFEKVDSNALIFGVDSSALRRMVEAGLHSAGLRVVATPKTTGAALAAAELHDAPMLFLSVRLVRGLPDRDPASFVELRLQRGQRPDGSRPRSLWEAPVARERSPSLTRLAEGIPRLLQAQIAAFLNAVEAARARPA